MINDAEERDERPTRNVYTSYYWVLGGLLALLILGVTVSPKPKQFPPELQGVWRTAETGHRDRSMEISAVAVSFATGEGASTGIIRHFDVEPQVNEMLYTIKYRGDDGDGTVWLLYNPGTKVLRVRNQPSVGWQRTETD